MTGVILQPSYIPWRGYFHQIHRADVFVFYDDVQYDKHGWRNRNRVKTPNGVQWLSIPVASSGCVIHNTLIKDISIVWTRNWAVKHWSTLQQAYAKRAPFFSDYAPLLRDFYTSRQASLADFTIELTVALSRSLGITHTRFFRSSELNVSGTRVDRLIAILNKIGADHYVTGPTARDYLDPSKLQSAGITLEYMKYDYPEYDQLYPPYDPAVSVLDLLFMKGPESPQYIWGKLDPGVQ